jgi:CheY-like chemotaxis protein
MENSFSFIKKWTKKVFLSLIVWIMSIWLVFTFSDPYSDDFGNLFASIALTVIIIFIWKKVDAKYFSVHQSSTNDRTKEDALENIFEDEIEEKMFEEDELYEKAKELVIAEGKASTSFLQRRLKTGYLRSARLIDQLEKDGIISEPDGTNPRKVIQDPIYSNTNEHKVLFVCNDSFLGEIYQKKLGEKGIIVKYLPWPTQDIIDIIKKFNPNIIITGLIMADIDGYQLLEIVKNNKETKNIPVFVLSNLSEQHDIKKALDLGAEEYWNVSDLTLEQITNKVCKIIENL